MALSTKPSADQLRGAVRRAGPVDKARLLRVLRRAREAAELPSRSAEYRERHATRAAYQSPPGSDWRTWVLLAGRNAGKSWAVTNWLAEHLLGPPCSPRVPGGHRVVMVGPTLGDAVASLVAGPAGLGVALPGARAASRAGGTYVDIGWDTEVGVLGAHSPEDEERWRAHGNNCAVVCDELAAWRHGAATWRQIRLGLRLGPSPRAVVATTPRPVSHLRELLADETTVVTTGRTADNPDAPPDVVAELYTMFAGTALGRRELEGEMLDDIEGALWTWAMIDGPRVAEAPKLDRVVVGVDPSGSSTGAEAGIIVAGSVGRRADMHIYVLADYSTRARTTTWIAKAVAAYDLHDADRLAWEPNFGGQMLEDLIRTHAPAVPLAQVRASRGKAIRAEVAQSLAEGGRLHHVGRLDGLESELVSWVPPGTASNSPGRLDALVIACTELLRRRGPTMCSQSYL